MTFEKPEADMMDKEEVKTAFHSLFKWLDWMYKNQDRKKNKEWKKDKKKALPKTLKAFMKLARVPEHKNIRKRYGLLRFGPWRRLLFDTKNSKGAYLFLALVREFSVEKNGKLEWVYEEWKKHLAKIETYAGYVGTSDMDEEVDPDSNTNPDNSDDGTSPQKGDNPPI